MVASPEPTVIAWGDRSSTTDGWYSTWFKCDAPLMRQLAAHAAVQWLVTDQRPAAQLISTWPLRIMRLQV